MSATKRPRLHRPFAQALEYVRSLGLANQSGYRERSKLIGWPADVPREPARVHRDSGWQGFEHWLGTGEHAAPMTRTATVSAAVGNVPVATPRRPSPRSHRSPAHKGCPECPHCQAMGVGLDTSIRLSPRTPSQMQVPAQGSASSRARCTVPNLSDPQARGERAADVLATHVELASTHDRYNPTAPGERPMREQVLRYVAAKIPGLQVAGTNAPDGAGHSQGSAVVAHAAHERTARPVDKPLHRVIWPKLKVNDCACRYALHYFASYVHSGDYAEHYTPGGSARDRYMSRERKIRTLSSNWTGCKDMAGARPG